eukprot:789715-Rhodomonas_salina.5
MQVSYAMCLCEWYVLCVTDMAYGTTGAATEFAEQRVPLQQVPAHPVLEPCSYAEGIRFLHPFCASHTRTLWGCPRHYYILCQNRSDNPLALPWPFATSVPAPLPERFCAAAREDCEVVLWRGWGRLFLVGKGRAGKTALVPSPSSPPSTRVLDVLSATRPRIVGAGVCVMCETDVGWRGAGPRVAGEGVRGDGEHGGRRASHVRGLLPRCHVRTQVTCHPHVEKTEVEAGAGWR